MESPPPPANSTADLRGETPTIPRQSLTKIDTAAAESSTVAPLAGTTHRTRARVIAVARILATHCDEAISLDQLADTVSMDRFELSRQFTREMGRSIRSYIAECRIGRAKQLLLTDRSITDIAQAVGYSDLPRFDEMFKALVGKSPSEFRRSAKDVQRHTRSY
jgi:transcriptional regulator GlxA family with amidase domain